MRPQRLADALVRLASHLVPKWQRPEWQREWRAEMQHGTDDPIGRSAGAFADAVCVRGQAANVDLWLGDLRLACRSAVRRPAFTLLVVLTLALGLGSTAAVVALIDDILLRPLPYRDPSRLVFVWHTLPEHNVFELEITPFDYQSWLQARSFSSQALASPESFTLTGGDEPERVKGARVTASMLPLLGLAPQIGRGFAPAEDRVDAPPVVILSDGVWRRRFASSPAVLGRTIQVDGVDTTIVGVLSPSAALPGPLAGSDDLWLPMRMTGRERHNEIGHNYTAIARLANGVSLEQASAEMTALASSIATTRPDTHRGIGVRLVPAAKQTTRDIRPALFVLVSGVVLLMVVASANAATLLLARASNRRQDLAVRAALGADRIRLLSLVCAESVVLAILGGLAAVMLGDWILRGLVPLFSHGLRTTAVSINARIATLTMVAALLIGGACGVVVAAGRSTEWLGDALRSRARTSGSRDIRRARNLLVVAQVAFAVLLLTGAGLMVRSFVRLAHVQPGFATDHLLTFRIALPASAYPTAETRAAFVRGAVGRLGAIPGVVAVAVNTRLPFGHSRGANGIAIEGREPSHEQLVADQREVTPEYFKALGMRVVQGRPFTTRDDSRGEPVAIVNRAMAQIWAGRDPLNQRVRVTAGDESSGWLRIVGVVNDVRHIDLSRSPVAELYRPYAQMPLDSFMVVVRSAGEPAAIAPQVRSGIWAIDRNLPLYDTRTMETRLAGSVAQTRAIALLLLVTATLAAVLAATAIYGSIWYSVTQRIPEIAIRLALGSTRAALCRLVVGRALTLTALGLVIGLGASVAVAPLLRTMLFETRPLDPATYLAVLGVLVLLTVVASVVPAKRAMGVDPVVTLRE
jgi:putative ABC transport system permease protein